MLQNISLIVCIKVAKYGMMFPSHDDLNGALGVGVCQIYFSLKCL